MSYLSQAGSTKLWPRISDVFAYSCPEVSLRKVLKSYNMEASSKKVARIFCDVFSTARRL